MKIYRKWFAARLKEARLAAKLKQREVALLMDVDASAISKWETGDDSPDDKRLPKLCEVLHVEVDYFDPGSKATAREFFSAADFLSTFAGLPPPYQKVILAIAYKDPSFVADLPESLGKPLQALLKAR